MKQRAKKFNLVIPLDASAIQDVNFKLPLKVMVIDHEGRHQMQTVELSAEGVGEAEFTFDEHPDDVQVLVGPASASEEDLEGMQTLRIQIPARRWQEDSVLKAQPLMISPYFWHWWLSWCRTFTIRGRVLCPNGDPVPGAKVCARDVDRFFIWTSTEEIGCATTDANGTFEMTFRWCCGWWPWWWLRHRFWEINPVLWGKLQELLHSVIEVEPIPIPGPRPDPAFLEKLLELQTEVKPGPHPPVAKVAVERTVAPMMAPVPHSMPEKAMLDPAYLEQLRPRLAEQLPHLADILQPTLYPWFPWQPWWDCNPDVIFKVTQVQGGEEVVLVDETADDTRWNIGVDTNVTLVANENAWCIPPMPYCAGGNCMAFTTVCANPVSSIGGNPGAVASPRGYLSPGVASIGGDRPYAGVVNIHGTSTCLTQVDYYEFEWSDDGGSSWNAMPPDAIGTVVRGYIDFDKPLNDPDFSPKIAFTRQHIDGKYVLETIAHYEATHPASGWGNHQVWAYHRDRLFAWKTAKHFPDGEYLLRVVGYDLVGSHLQNRRVLQVCQHQAEAHLVLHLDNRTVTPGASTDAYGSPCGTKTVHLCTTEPSTEILGMRLLHQGGGSTEVGACGFVDLQPHDQLQIDFTAYDPDGHLSYFTLDLTYANNLRNRLLSHLGASGVSLVPLGGGPVPAAAQVGPNYPSALSQGAVSPIWNGGAMRLTMPASQAFPITCSYQVELWAHKRTVVNCNHSLWSHSNLSERSFAVKK